MHDNWNLGRRRFLAGAGAAALGVNAGISRAATQLVAGTAQSPPAGWWNSPYRIVQTNLREIDVLEDPREIARAVREFGGNVLVTNIGGIVAFYPTKLDLQYANPYLKGDFAGEMIEAARAEGLKVVGRFDLSKAMKPAFDAHPDWFMRNRDGSPRVYEGTYQACPNGGWAQLYGFRILAEGVARHRTDAFFFNMTGYPETDYANVRHGICTCDNCRAGFRKQTGLELPAKEGFEDPNWVPYLQFQDRTSEALLTRVNAYISGIHDVPIMAYWTYDAVGRGEAQRRVDRAAPEWPYQAGEQAREALARNPGKPFSATSAAHIDYPWRQVTETAACHELRIAQQLGLGLAPDLYLMGSLKGQDDQSWLSPVADLFRWHRANAAHYAGLAPAARIGLYSSFKAARFGGGTPAARYRAGAFRGAYMAVVDSRLPFQMVNDARVEDGTTRLPGAFDAIILPHVELVSEREIAALDAYVAAGGLLIATGQTGACDANGKDRAGIGFASFPASAYKPSVDAHGWTANLDTADLKFGQGRMMIDEAYFPLAPRDDAQTLVGLAPDQRFGPPEFSYPVPGDKPRTDPVVLARRHGKGMAVQIPWLADWLYQRHGLEAHQRMIAAIVRRFAPPPPFVLEGAGPVELMAMRKADGSGDLLHIVNYAGQRNGRYDDPPTISGLRLGVIKAGRTTPVVQCLRANTPAVAAKGEDSRYAWFALPPVSAFEALVVT